MLDGPDRAVWDNLLHEARRAHGACVHGPARPPRRFGTALRRHAGQWPLAVLVEPALEACYQ